MVFRDITEKRAVNKMIRLAQDSNLQKELKMFKIYVIFSHLNEEDLFILMKIMFLCQIIYLLNNQEAETISG